MRKLQIAVVDDGFDDREWLTDKINDYCRIREIDHVVYQYTSGEAFVSALQEIWFDIVFMDIYMDGISGVEAARALRAKDRYRLARWGFALQERRRVLRAFSIRP